MILLKVVNIDVNFMTGLCLTQLFKEILWHALTTHILGAILAEKALQAHIFLNIIFFGFFNCGDQFFPSYL